MDSEGLIQSQHNCIMDYQKALKNALTASDTWNPKVSMVANLTIQKRETIKIIQEVYNKWNK